MPIWSYLRYLYTFPVPKGKHLPLSALLASVYFHHRYVIKTGAITLLLLPLCPSKSQVGRTVMREGGRVRERKGEKEREENGIQKGMRRNEATSDMAEGQRRKKRKIVRQSQTTGLDRSRLFYQNIFILVISRIPMF